MMSAKRPRFIFMIHFGQLVTIDLVILFAKGVQDMCIYTIYIHTCIGMYIYVHIHVHSQLATQC